jgi:hypothetical protein
VFVQQVQDNYTVDTRDHEDHTFCGIMFDIQTKDNLPVPIYTATTSQSHWHTCHHHFS